MRLLFGPSHLARASPDMCKRSASKNHMSSSVWLLQNSHFNLGSTGRCIRGACKPLRRTFQNDASNALASSLLNMDSRLANVKHYVKHILRLLYRSSRTVCMQSIHHKCCCHTAPKTSPRLGLTGMPPMTSSSSHLRL